MTSQPTQMNLNPTAKQYAFLMAELEATKLLYRSTVAENEKFVKIIQELYTVNQGLMALVNEAAAQRLSQRTGECSSAQDAGKGNTG
jgi:hypothetical protein